MTSSTHLSPTDSASGVAAIEVIDSAPLRQLISGEQHLQMGNALAQLPCNKGRCCDVDAVLTEMRQAG